MILVEIFAAFYVTLATLALASLLWSALNGIPYVPSNTRQVEAVLQRLKLPARTRLLDLGSGDGRIVLMAASRLGWQATGIEINPLLTILSRLRAVLTRTSGAGFRTANFMNISFSGYDVIFIFGFPPMMRRLYPKLLKECPPGTWIVSNSFTFRDLRPQFSQGEIFVYRLHRP